MKLLWGAAFAAGTVLLMALQVVVGQGVRQGEARRAQVARHAEAMSTCGRLQARSARDSCRAGAD
jgi:MFS-type transporter involved in bile tolerance (Atg22 family)